MSKQVEELAEIIYKKYLDMCASTLKEMDEFIKSHPPQTATEAMSRTPERVKEKMYQVSRKLSELILSNGYIRKSEVEFELDEEKINKILKNPPFSVANGYSWNISTSDGKFTDIIEALSRRAGEIVRVKE